jgi:uncharacterized protein YjbJ (UPF0337 family)
MDGKRNHAKRRVEEATGARTEDESLKNKGGLDQLVETLKEKAAKATEKMRSVLAGKTLPNRTK